MKHIEPGVTLTDTAEAYGTVRTEYSLWFREPEREILPVTRELGIGFVPRAPLGKGFPTGRFGSFDELPADDFRRGPARFVVPIPGTKTPKCGGRYL